MSIIAISVIGVITAVTSLSLRRYNAEISFAVAVIGAVLMFSSVIINISSTFDTVKNVISSADIDYKYVGIMLKCAGICILTEFACDLCSDAGQKALAANVSLAGKVLVITAALPMYQDILNIVISLID